MVFKMYLCIKLLHLKFLHIQNFSSFKSSSHLKFLYMTKILHGQCSLRPQEISSVRQGPHTIVENILFLVWFPGAELPFYQYGAKLSWYQIVRCQIVQCQTVLVPNFSVIHYPLSHVKHWKINTYFAQRYTWEITSSKSLRMR